jgi:ribosomal protein S18 acetylase RimI-like enzyme
MSGLPESAAIEELPALPDRDYFELDNPVWAALHGPHREFVETCGQAVRYRADVSGFAAIERADDPTAWDDLGALAGSGVVALMGVPPRLVPEQWHIVRHLPAIQMVEGPQLREVRLASADLIRLGIDDVEEILRLVQKTEPGPFLARTVELGGYLGVRADIEGAPLVAMAGQRVATGNWREISAVCTDPAYRGRGLARELVDAVIANAHSRGERTFLHVLLGNPAIGLYDAMGFRGRRALDIVVIEPR